jgi:hypothetical protein
MEIERKFLVNSLPPNWKRGSGSEILQGYFSLSSRDVEIRLRRKDSQHFLTVKSGRGPGSAGGGDTDFRESFREPLAAGQERLCFEKAV